MAGSYWDRFNEKFPYSKYLNREKPLKPWTDADVEAFIASDPVHGPTLKTAREAIKYAVVGSAIGAGSTAGVAWMFSKSPHGTALALGAGAVFGMVFGKEVANHALQLYKLDTMKAQVKFLDWWASKTEGSF
uniref:Succinate dehydrogenase subunit 6, mitochondrial n=1 Tax=Kalanchoe fedtschenkoi TaxID=63787 RepID=A0A7N0VH24_KALFE